MKLNNKSGLLGIGFSIYMILFSTILIVFTAIMIFEANGQYAIDPLLVISEDLNNASVISDLMLTHEVSLADAYHNLNWYPDFLTLYALLIGFVTTSIGAFKSKKYGFVGFFGWLTVGSYIFLLVGAIVFQIINWFWSQYFEKLFYDLSYSLLFTEWVIEFSAPLLFGWWLWLVFLAEFELPGKFKGKELDLDGIKDEEVFIE